jgi:redox-sensitive bicupin YhaK (pirin superfamily)
LRRGVEQLAKVQILDSHIEMVCYQNESTSSAARREIGRFALGAADALGARMITIRRQSERGHGNFGWLDTRHTFSFGHFYEPEQMGFSHLRVINEDRVQPGEGFPRHSHRDMEIVSYVLEGALEHKDSTGGGGILRAGDVQRMTAGSGVTHSERNPSPDEAVHFLQIWIMPARAGLPPSYEQKQFDRASKLGRLRLLASPDGSDDSLVLHQDARLFGAVLDPGQEVSHRFAPGRKGWIQVARGQVLANGRELFAGDGAALTDEPVVTLAGAGDAELLLFDLP